MRYKWKYIYLCWAVLWVVSGYRTVASSHIVDFTNVGWPFIIANFSFFTVVPLITTALKRLLGFQMTFRRPSLSRSPFGWGRDPLQVFRLFLITATSMTIGTCLALPKADNGGVILFWACVAGSAGLFVGERLIYLIYAKEISVTANI